MSERLRILSPARNEYRDVPFRYIAAGGAWVALALAIVLGVAFWLFPHATTDQFVTTPVPPFAGPHLQASPRLDMQEFAVRQKKALNGVYWIDRGQGIVHLPIDDAMRKVAEEGIPDWPGPR